jgi:hypothetical protein
MEVEEKMVKRRVRRERQRWKRGRELLGATGRSYFLFFEPGASRCWVRAHDERRKGGCWLGEVLRMLLGERGVSLLMD